MKLKIFHMTFLILLSVSFSDIALSEDIGLQKMNPVDDRAMICGSPEMLKDTQDLLDSMNFKVSPRIGEPGDYVIEHAFVEK